VLFAFALNIAGTTRLMAGDSHDSEEIRKETVQDESVTSDKVEEKLKAADSKEKFFLFANAYFAKLKKEGKELDEAKLKALFSEDKQQKWIGDALAAWNWDAEKLIEWAEKVNPNDEEKPKQAAAIYRIEWLRTDPKVAFLMQNFPLSLKDAIRFFKAIERDDKSAGKALAELVFSLEGEALNKFLANIEKITSDAEKDKPPYKGNKKFFDPVKWAAKYRKDNAHSDKATADFKAGFDPQKEDKLKANKAFAESLGGLKDELKDVAGFDDTKKAARSAAQDKLREAMPSAASIGFYAEADPAKAIRDARALARVTTDGKVWLDLDASHPGYNPESANKKQSLYLGDASKQTTEQLDQSILGALKTLNNPVTAGKAGEGELLPYVGKVPNRLSEFSFGKDPAGRARFAVPPASAGAEGPGVVQRLEDSAAPPAEVYLAKAPARTPTTPAAPTPGPVVKPSPEVMTAIASKACENCHKGQVTWSDGTFLRKGTPLEDHAKGIFEIDEGMTKAFKGQSSDPTKNFTDEQRKALADWVEANGGTVPDGVRP